MVDAAVFVESKVGVQEGRRLVSVNSSCRLIQLKQLHPTSESVTKPKQRAFYTARGYVRTINEKKKTGQRTLNMQQQTGAHT